MEVTVLTEPRNSHVCVWQPTWYRLTTPKFLLNLQTNETSLKWAEGEVSGQTTVARYIPLLRLLNSYLGGKIQSSGSTVLLLGLQRQW